jgi:hypothetical protein
LLRSTSILLQAALEGNACTPGEVDRVRSGFLGSLAWAALARRRHALSHRPLQSSPTVASMRLPACRLAEAEEALARLEAAEEMQRSLVALLWRSLEGGRGRAPASRAKRRGPVGLGEEVGAALEALEREWGVEG